MEPGKEGGLTAAVKYGWERASVAVTRLVGSNWRSRSNKSIAESGFQYHNLESEETG